MEKTTADYSEYATSEWIHFSNHPELKLNPDPFHQDPLGIYLFPASFKPNPVWRQMKYRYRISVSLDPARILDLAHVTLKEAKEYLRKLDITKYTPEYLEKNPADHMWEAMKNHYTGRRASWNKDLRTILGFDAVFDDTGSIHSSENQLLVLDPRKVQVIERVDQSDSGYGDLIKVMDHLEGLLKPYGEVVREEPKKDKEFGASMIRGGFSIGERPGPYAYWSVSLEIPKDKASPDWISVFLRSSSSNLGWERSIGERIERFGGGGQPDLDLSQMDREVIGAMDKIFGSKKVSSYNHKVIESPPAELPYESGTVISDEDKEATGSGWISWEERGPIYPKGSPALHPVGNPPYGEDPVVASTYITAAQNKPKFKKTPKPWDGKTIQPAYMAFEDKVYVIDGNECQWVKDYLDIPESNLYYMFFARAAGEGEQQEQDPPLPLEIPKEFYEMYRTAIYSRDMFFKTFKADKNFQSMILKVLTSRRDRPANLTIETVTPLRRKNITTQAFLKNGMKALAETLKANIEGFDLSSPRDHTWAEVDAETFQDEGFVGENWGSSGSGILFKHENKVLLLFRSDWVADPHTWGIPGGAVPVDSSGKPMDAKASAKRETEEEIGMVPPARDTQKKTEFKKGSFKYTTYLFEAKEEFDPILNAEHTDAKWFPIDDLPSDIHPGVKWSIDQFFGKKTEAEHGEVVDERLLTREWEKQGRFIHEDLSPPYYGDHPMYDPIMSPALASEKATAGISPVLYHITSLHNALNIFEENRFNLRFAYSSDDLSKPKNKLYFLSTMRVPSGGYREQGEVTLVLDGTKLGQKYKGSPVDYWGESFKKAAEESGSDRTRYDETEDRIWNTDPTIPNASSYIKEVHCFFDRTGKYARYASEPVFAKHMNERIKKLSNECEKKGIPLYIYSTYKDKQLLNKAKAKKLEDLNLVDPEMTEKQKEWYQDDLSRPKSRGYYGDDNTLALIELYEHTKDQSVPLSDRAHKLWNYMYSTQRPTIINDDMRHSSPEVQKKLTDIWKKENIKNSKEFVDFMNKRLNSIRSSVTANKELEDDVVKAFKDLANQQRGAPESAMLKYQKFAGGGVMSYAVEHTGDLTHRMAELVWDKGERGFGREYVLTKIENVLDSLKRAYGFKKEHIENLISNYQHDKNKKAKTLEEFFDQADALLAEYAKEHSKLPVYNRAQWLAREAAVALGNKLFYKCETYLEELLALCKNAETWREAASEHRRDSSGHLVQYKPEVTSSNEDGDSEMKKSIRSSLDEDILIYGELMEGITKEEIKKQFAGSTSFLHFPVTVGGDPDHHITVKFFDKTPVTPEQIEKITKDIPKAPPKEFTWEPVVFQGKRGEVKVLELKGIPENLPDLHNALEEVRPDDYPDYRPHITVSEELWQKIKNEGLQPKDLGVKVGPLTFENKGKVEKIFGEVKSVVEDRLLRILPQINSRLPEGMFMRFKTESSSAVDETHIYDLFTGANPEVAEKVGSFLFHTEGEDTQVVYEDEETWEEELLGSLRLEDSDSVWIGKILREFGISPNLAVAILAAKKKKAMEIPESVMPTQADDFSLNDTKKVLLLQYEGKALRADSFQEFQELLSKILLELQLTEEYRKSVAGILNQMRAQRELIAL